MLLCVQDLAPHFAHPGPHAQSGRRRRRCRLAARLPRSLRLAPASVVDFVFN
jgi:hypothetical protein